MQMNHIEAMKQALEALLSAAAELYRASSYCNTYEVLGNTNDAITALRVAIASYSTTIHATELREAAEKQQALDKKAAVVEPHKNARELGLDYEPGTCNGMPAYEGPLSAAQRPSPATPVQEPVGLIESLKDAQPCCGQYEACHRACTPRGKFLGQREAQRQWVGLTDEEVDEAARYCVKSGQSVNAAMRAIEALLREKNGGAA